MSQDQYKQEDFDLLQGGVAFESFTKRAKKRCKNCHGKGFLLFDSGNPTDRFVQPCCCTMNRSLRKLLHHLHTKYDSR